MKTYIVKEAVDIMIRINKKLYELKREDVFSNVTKKVNEFRTNNPGNKLISLGIGDVSKPVVKPIIDAMHKAVDDLSDMETFRGYCAYSGHDFLKDKILQNDYKDFSFSREEIYVSAGTKTDCTSILELFDIDAKICITNPMYPVYKDGATCLNRELIELSLSSDKEFVSDIPQDKYDVIYVCSPNNPIGIAYTYDELSSFVEYALANDCVILYDNVYETFITSPNVPRSIYEIPNAKKVAIEFRSYSKSASFSGVRCSYYVIPNDIHKDINALWMERTINRFNGTDYIAQRGAEAFYSPEAQKLIKKNTKEYMDNTQLLRKTFIDLGFEVWGGLDCPYLWVKIKDNLKSWAFFDLMLEKLNIIIIPGAIFGSYGDEYFRVSGLGYSDDTKEAVRRLKKHYEKKI